MTWTSLLNNTSVTHSQAYTVPFLQGKWTKISVRPFRWKRPTLLCGMSSYIEGTDSTVMGNTVLIPSTPLTGVFRSLFLLTQMWPACRTPPYTSWGREAVRYGRCQVHCLIIILYPARGLFCPGVVAGFGCRCPSGWHRGASLVGWELAPLVSSWWFMREHLVFDKKFEFRPLYSHFGSYTNSTQHSSDIGPCPGITKVKIIFIDLTGLRLDSLLWLDVPQMDCGSDKAFSAACDNLFYCVVFF